MLKLLFNPWPVLKHVTSVYEYRLDTRFGRRKALNKWKRDKEHKPVWVSLARLKRDNNIKWSASMLAS